MALRIDTAVLKGELDSTERGRVRGRLWLLGREEPVVLDLSGDPWRDVAGMQVTFVNPTPVAQEAAAWLSPVQTGAVGDITASRKVKVFTVAGEEWREALREDRLQDVPTEWRNSLYLEWFSIEQGRCVIESADFEISISAEPAWQMDEDEEGAQKLANMQAMRDFLAAVIQRPEPRDDDDDNDEDAFSEEAWEDQLKASDRLNDANMEAMDKYGEDDDAEEKTAFVMGWDHLLEDMADAEEGVEPSENDSDEKKRRREWVEMMNQACEEVESGSWEDEGEAAEEEPPHPLREFSHDLVIRMIGQLREAGLDDVRGEDRDHPLDCFMVNVMQISGKLAGALRSGRGDSEIDIDTGYTLAITKRCLNWANEALAAVEKLTTMAEFTAHRDLFESWRADLFKLREGITDLRRELRGE